MTQAEATALKEVLPFTAVSGPALRLPEPWWAAHISFLYTLLKVCVPFKLGLQVSKSFLPGCLFFLGLEDRVRQRIIINRQIVLPLFLPQGNRFWARNSLTNR